MMREPIENSRTMPRRLCAFVPLCEPRLTLGLPLSPALALPLLWLVAIAACCSLIASDAQSDHPVSVTRAYVYVSRDQATAKLEVFLEDLFLFHNLKPNDQDFLAPDVIQRGIELHQRFIAERFLIRDVSGEPLALRIIGVDATGLPDEGVPLAELMAYTLTFELQFEFPSPPEFLTISQRFTDDNAVFPSEMKLVLKQEGTDAPHPVELQAEDVEHFRREWDLPPLSAEASAEEREQFVTKQKEEALGITSYSSVYSFLYIDDYEVRHEILIPLLTLEESVLIARDEDEFLDLAEQEVARQQVEAYFGTGNPIEINGVVVPPRVQRCDFYGLDFKDFAQQAPSRRVPLVSARVGIILAYPVATPLQDVKLTWNRFNDFVWTVNTVVFAHESTTKTTLSRLRQNNIFLWKNPGRPIGPPPEPVVVAPAPRATLLVPMLSVCWVVLGTVSVIWMWRRRSAIFACSLAATVYLLAAGLSWPVWKWPAPHPWPPRPTVRADRAAAVFGELHANLYRAFEFKEENAIYDTLACSVHDELLRDVYLQVRLGLVMQEQGGAVSRISEVAIVNGDLKPFPDQQRNGPSDGRGFGYQCRWNVAGTVEHWGHIHQRTNQYEALFTLEPVDNVWMVTKMELLDEKRVGFETRLRGS